MPLPEPRQEEEKNNFVSRCMADVTMNNEFPNQEQRAAVCNSQWEKGQSNNMENNKQITSLIHNMSQIVDIRSMEGKEYYVAPTIMIVEGVLNNRFYSRQEISEHPQQWNGRPVIIQHSTDDNGNPKSANDPEERDKRTVGWLYNTRYEDGKLKSEAWIDPERCEHVEHGNVILHRLENNLPIEVSTGLWTTDIQQNGQFNGENYEAVATDLGADHLALLPYEQGACSWNDGAGLPRINKEKHMNKIKNNKKTAIGQLLDSIKSGVGFKSNQTSIRDIQKNLLEQLEGIYESDPNPHNRIVYLQDVLLNDNEVVFEVMDNTDNSKLYKQNYNIESERAILEEGEPEEVYLKTEYVPVTNQNLNENNDNDVDVNTNNKETDKMDKSQIIDYLIENSEKYQGLGKEVLENLDEKVLNKMKESCEEVTQLKADKEKSETQENNSKESDTKKTQTENEQEDKTFRFNTQEELLAAMPDGEIKENLEEAVTMRANQHQKLVKSLFENERNEYTEDELKAMSLTQLKKMASLARVPTFEGVQGGEAPQTNTNKAPDMPTINWSEKRKIETSEE